MTNQIVKLRRFEFAYQNEPQGVGLFNGIYEAGLSDEIIKNMEREFENLPLPIVSRPTSFWFTELGFETFRSAIDAVANTTRDLGWTLVTAEKDLDLADATYVDNFQAGFPPELVGEVAYQEYHQGDD